MSKPSCEHTVIERLWLLIVAFAIAFSPSLLLAESNSLSRDKTVTLTKRTVRALKRLYIEHEAGHSFGRLVLKDGSDKGPFTRLARTRALRMPGPTQLDLRPHLNNLSEQSISVVERNGSTRSIRPPRLYSFGGSLRLAGKSRNVDLFVYNSEVFGFASSADGRTFDVRGKPTRSGALRLRSREQRDQDHALSCGLTDTDASTRSSQTSDGEFRRQSTRDIVQFDVAMVTSCGMVQNAGSAERAAIFAAAAVSSMNVFYVREARIRINILKQKLYSSCDNDPIHQKMVNKVDTSAPQTMASFRALAATLPETSDPNVDIAFLRYKAIPGYSTGLVGYANQSGACSASKYGLSLQFEDSLLFSLERSIIAHEIGHLLGAEHYTCGMSSRDPQAYFRCPYLMFPALNYAVKLGEFTVNQFNAFVETRSCWSIAPPRIGSAPYFESGDDGRDEIFLRVPEGLEAEFNIPIKDPDNDLVTIRSEWPLPAGVRIDGNKLKIFKPLNCSAPPPPEDLLLLTAVDAAGHETSGEIRLYYWRSPLFGTGTVNPADPYGPIDSRDTVLYVGDHYSKSFALGIPGISYRLETGNKLEGVGDLLPFTFDASRAGIDWRVTENDVGRRFEIRIMAERCGETFQVLKRFAVLSKPGVPAIYKEPWTYMLQEGISHQFNIKVISGIDFSTKTFQLELVEPKPKFVQSFKDGILSANSGDDGVKGCVKDNPYDILKVPMRLIDPATGESSLTYLELLHLNLGPPMFSGLVDSKSEPVWRSRETYVKVGEERSIPIHFKSDEPNLPYTLEASDYSKEYALFDAQTSTLKMKGIWPPDRALQINSSAYRPASLILHICPQDGRAPTEIKYLVEVSNWRSYDSTPTPTPTPTPTTPAGEGGTQPPTPTPTQTIAAATPTPTELSAPSAERSAMMRKASSLQTRIKRLQSSKAPGLRGAVRAKRLKAARQLRTAVFDFIARFEALRPAITQQGAVAPLETLESGALKLARQAPKKLVGTKRAMIAALSTLRILLD